MSVADLTVDLPDDVLTRIAAQAAANGRSESDEALALLEAALQEPAQARGPTRMLKIWGRINSINVQKAVWAVIETGVPFERVDAGMAFGVVGTPEFRAKNPNARIPVLEDNGFVLWESNAIVRYLAATYSAGKLWPNDPKARAHADQWMDWASLSLLAAMTPPFWQLIRTPEDKRDMSAVEDGRQKTEALLAILDEHLGRQPFVAGETFTMGDIAVGVCAHRWLLLPIAREPRPRVERWLAGLRARPRAGEALIAPVT